jgi:phosphoenolpyruvate-protein kinase (PTS system EI component)
MRRHWDDLLVETIMRKRDVGPLVDGLVLEIGGQLSHGAIVAREYGIPAVVNAADATLRIRDGQLLLVDGTSGRVYIEGGASEAVGRVKEE